MVVGSSKEGWQQLVGSRFVISGELGSGAMGVVYRAYDKERRISLALKTLRNTDAQHIYRFKNEFRALADLVHPNLVTLYELAVDNDLWFFTMELIDGVSFLEYVRPHRALVEPSTAAAGSTGEDTATALTPSSAAPDVLATSATAALPSGSSGRNVGHERRRRAILQATLHPDRLAVAMAQIARGVMALHRGDKLHRDLKPSNTLIESNGRATVCDFGLVDSLAHQHASRAIMGTPGYMSPEQAAGQALTDASDWYSVGVMLFEALTGELPFSGAGHVILEAKKTVDAPPVERLAPSTPAAWAALCNRLLARDPNLRPSGADVLAAFANERAVSPSLAPPREAAPLFVGREAHLQALERARADVIAGECVAAFVRGGAGMGKTALAQRFLDQLPRDSDCLILSGRCYQRESVPYKSLDALVDELTDHLMRLPAAQIAKLPPESLSAITHLFPAARRLAKSGAALSHALAVPRDAVELRKRAFGGLRAILAHLARTRTVILYIDDLQWGDVDSVTFFSGLLSDADAPPLLLLATYRTEEEHTSSLLQALRIDDARRNAPQRVRVVDVEPLTVAESERLAEELFASSSADSPRAAAIARAAGGCPFFVAELVRADNAGVSARESSEADLAEVLAARIEQLPAPARELLSAAAVAGRPTPAHLLSEAVGVTDQLSALATLRKEHMIRELGAGFNDEVEPFHDRIREVVTQRMSARETRRVHRRLARAFERSTIDAPHALVEHWLGAGDRGKAGENALRAAEQAEGALAFDRAAHHYALALDLLDLDDDQSVALGTRLADNLSRAGRQRAAAAAYLETADKAPFELALELRRLASEQLMRSGQMEEGLSLIRELLDSVGVSVPRSSAGVIASILYGRTLTAVRGRTYRRTPPEAIDPLDLWRLRALWSLVSSVNVTNPVLGYATSMIYQRLALRTGDAYHAATSLALSGVFASSRGVSQRAAIERLRKELRAIAEESGDPHALGVHLVSMMVARFVMGQWRESVDYAEEAFEVLVTRCSNARYEADQTLLFGLMGRLELGELGNVAEEVPVLLREALERGNDYLSDGLRTWRTSLTWLILDDPETARDHVEAVAATQHLTGSFILPHYYRMRAAAQIELYCGDGARAAALLDRSWSAFSKSVTSKVQVTRLDALYLRARTAIARAMESDSPEALLRAATRDARAIAREKVDWARGSVALIRAGVAVGRGDHTTALEECDAAIASARVCGMQLIATIAALRRGQLLGGDEGAAQVAQALAWLREQRVVRPLQFADLIAPGRFPSGTGAS